MDTGETWYINSSSVSVNGFSRPSFPIMTKQSESVIGFSEGGQEHYLFASRPATARIHGSLKDMEDTQEGIVSDRVRNRELIVRHRYDTSNVIYTTTGLNGEFDAAGVIPGDEYEVVIDDRITRINPHTDDDDIGTISVKKGVNFKTRIHPVSAPFNMRTLYAGFKTYDFTITIVNTGDEDCLAATYELSFDDDLVVGSKPASQVLGTIEPGQFKTLAVSLSCKDITNDREFKKIRIKITDEINHKVWRDAVTLKFHKVPVNFNIQSSAYVRGVVLGPDIAYPFASNNSASVVLPWSKKDYLVVFSGATSYTESIYSLGINTVPDTNFVSFTDLGNHEPNNRQGMAASVSITGRIMSYLHKNDIDYYKINLGNTAPELKPIALTGLMLQDMYTNTTSQVSPGITSNLNIILRNNTISRVRVSSAVLESSSEYVSINEGINDTIGDIYPELSKTKNNAFNFSIGQDCPVGIELPFTITFTDFYANTWIENFTLQVIESNSGTVIVINTPKENNYAIGDSLTTGNKDGFINPGESFYIDLRLKNTGTRQANLAKVILTNNNEYVDIAQGEVVFSSVKNLNPGHNLTLSSYGDEYLRPFFSAGVGGNYYFRINLSKNCPIGTSLSFDIKIVDNWGYAWADTISIPVVKTGADIAINRPILSNYKVQETAYTNRNDIANPGEQLYLDFWVKNAGYSSVLGLKAELSTDSIYVTIDEKDINIGTIRAGYYKTLYFRNAYLNADQYGVSEIKSGYLMTNLSLSDKKLTFSISGNCPPNTELPFILTFTDSWGNTWTDDLTIPVQ
jgi:hypothetical protein